MKNQVAKVKFLDNFDEIIIALTYVINILSFLISVILTIINYWQYIYIYIYIYICFIDSKNVKNIPRFAVIEPLMTYPTLLKTFLVKF